MKACKYWKDEKQKICRMCEEKEEDIEHVLEEFIETGTKIG